MEGLLCKAHIINTTIEIFRTIMALLAEKRLRSMVIFLFEGQMAYLFLSFIQQLVCLTLV